MTTDDESDRIAVFSDIHGNIHALEAVLAAIDALGVRRIYCLGDVIGYGAFPNECCEALRFRRIPTVAGNHDHAAIGRTEIKNFNDIARAAVEWTAARLSRDNVRWLGELPYALADDGCCFVHASPHEPEKWGYVLTFGDARLGFAAFGERFCFVGHSHQPAAVVLAGEEVFCPEGAHVALDPACRYLVNVGSVGQPRDHNPQAGYVLLDRAAGALDFRRAPYDVPAAQQAIRDNRLPVELAERLAYGW